MERNQDLFLGFFAFSFSFCFSTLHSEIALSMTLLCCFFLFFFFFSGGFVLPISVGTATFVECDDERERERKKKACSRKQHLQQQRLLPPLTFWMDWKPLPSTIE